jgi:hypothetical protein
MLPESVPRGLDETFSIHVPFHQHRVGDLDYSPRRHYLYFQTAYTKCKWPYVMRSLTCNFFETSVLHLYNEFFFTNWITQHFFSFGKTIFIIRAAAGVP